MQLYGNGVTKNFLGILDEDIRRSAKTIVRLLVLVTFLGLIGLLAYHKELWFGTGLFAGTFVLATILGVAYGHFVKTYRYQVSIREHWNRWMRFSVSCVTVRECYRKVHGKRTTPGVLWPSLFIAALIIAHLVYAVLALNEAAPLWQVLPIFLLDATLTGFVAGVRWRERRWYREFLRSVHELLQEGTIGVWGVY